MNYEDWSDADLLDELKDVDARADVTFSRWELEFADSMLGRDGSRPLAVGQRAKLIEVLREYEDA